MDVNLDDPVQITELMETPAGRQLVWRKQVEKDNGIVKGLLFWTGESFDAATCKAVVHGNKSQLLALFDLLVPQFVHVDFDV
jgi:hypothetical protein